MKNKQTISVLKYFADLCRAFGGAMFFVSLSAIMFDKVEATASPGATAAFVVLGMFTIGIGVVITAVSSDLEE